MQRIILLLFCFFSSMASIAESVPLQDKHSSAVAPAVSMGGCALRTELVPAAPEISSPFQLKCTITLPPGASLKFIELPEKELKNIEVVGTPVDTAPAVMKDGTTHLQRIYTLDSQLPEEQERRYVIPEIRASVLLEDNRAIELHSDERELTFSLPTEAALNDASIDLSDTPYTSLLTPAQRRCRVLLFTGIAAAVILLVLSFILYLRRRRRLAIENLPPPSPYEVAVKRLEELLRQSLPDAGEFKLYYSGLSAILREYIEGRFQINAPNLTTEEFLHSLTSRSLPELKEFRALLQSFLTECDLVKFAEQLPAPGQSARLAESCKDFLEKTHPSEASPEKKAMEGD